jgi:hypothetical protein
MKYSKFREGKGRESRKSPKTNYISLLLSWLLQHCFLLTYYGHSIGHNLISPCVLCHRITPLWCVLWNAIWILLFIYTDWRRVITFLESKFSDFCQNYWLFPRIEEAAVLAWEKGTCQSNLGFAGGHKFLFNQIHPHVANYWVLEKHESYSRIPLSTFFNTGILFNS